VQVYVDIVCSSSLGGSSDATAIATPEHAKFGGF
jgi:hypothetical protein